MTPLEVADKLDERGLDEMTDGKVERLGASTIRAQAAEIERLIGALKKSNDGFEEYERKFYLEQQHNEAKDAEIERLREAFDASPNVIVDLGLPSETTHPHNAQEDAYRAVLNHARQALAGKETK